MFGALTLAATTLSCQSEEAAKPSASAAVSASAATAGAKTAARFVESTAEAIALGKSTFGTCQGCHGENGVGTVGVGPRLASKSYLEAASDEFLVKTIQQGRPSTTMIPWKDSLNEKQIHGVIAYLRSLQPSEPATLDESPLKGNVEAGEKVFRDICSGCHGRTGAGYQETANGTGIGRKGFLDTASNGFIRHVVKHGKSQTKMRGFAEKNVTAVANLTDTQIEDTVAYLRSQAW